MDIHYRLWRSWLLLIFTYCGQIDWIERIVRFAKHFGVIKFTSQKVSQKQATCLNRHQTWWMSHCTSVTLFLTFLLKCGRQSVTKRCIAQIVTLFGVKCGQPYLTAFSCYSSCWEVKMCPMKTVKLSMYLGMSILVYTALQPSIYFIPCRLIHTCCLLFFVNYFKMICIWITSHSTFHIFVLHY